MDTFELLDKYIKDRTDKLGAFPDIVQKGVNTIAGEVPFKLKLAVTLAELITFSSHLRKPIKLYDGTLVPTNAIVFALAGSGESKDRAVNALRKSLIDGYKFIEEERKRGARKKAESKAILDGKKREEWQQYYLAPKPLQSGLGTAEGLLQHFAEISENTLGAGSITTSEIGTELQTNGSMIDIIKVMSQLYDLGNIDPKIIKSIEHQTAALKGFPANALFFGSHEAILFDAAVKAKFKLAFNTQLARRGIFTFIPESSIPLKISNVDELYKFREEERIRVVTAQNTLAEIINNITVNTNQEPLELTPNAQKLYDVYMEYNNILSGTLPKKYPLAKLSRKHKHWLALKLSGNYATLNGYDFINEETYAYAINTVELLAPQLSEFETELVKEPYEMLVNMCRYNATEGEYLISLHELKKQAYVIGAGQSKAKVEELAKLANSCDPEGSYSIHENGIQYKQLIKTDIVGVSHIFFDQNFDNKSGSEIKDFMTRNCAKGYEFTETDFEEISIMLEYNAAYSCFRFENGKRGKDNLIGGAKFVILDIDKSYITDEEVHVLLNEYNHYVVRTSDPENEFKFRVLLEFDSVVNIDERLWKCFLQEIGDELGLTIDILPQSQVFFSFAGRNQLKQLNGSTLKTKYLLGKASERFHDKPKAVSELPAKEKNNKLADPRESFSFAFTAEKGERSVKLYRALAYAIDLGADEEYIINIANEINDYWMESIDKDRLERTLITPALRRL